MWQSRKYLINQKLETDNRFCRSSSEPAANMRKIYQTTRAVLAKSATAFLLSINSKPA
jgi:hypothetical protein